MSDESRIEELLARWERLRAEGITVTAEELCASCPELLDQVRPRLQALLAMDQLLDLGPGDTGSADTSLDAEPANRELPAPAGAANGLRYRPLRLHAKGGLGEVYLARDEEVLREVALKRIQRAHAAHTDSRRRFLREAEITGRLEHPGVVPVYGQGREPDGRPFYAMRFIAGQTLQEAIQQLHGAWRPGRDPGEYARGLRPLLGRFVSVCNTVAYAHSKGVIHRDLKPANIMLGPYGETLVVDWGLAKPVGGEAEGHERDDASAPRERVAPDAATVTGSTVGTPGYMSPEQASGEVDPGPATDIFGLGATLYALLTAQVPYQGAHIYAVIDQARHGRFTPPRQVQSDVPRALEAICLKAMAVNPKDRYASALELAADVERWLADEPVSAYRESLAVQVRRWGRRHRTLVAATAALLLTAVVALTAGVVLLSREQARTARERDDKETAWQEVVAERDIARDQRDIAQEQRRAAQEQKRRTREALDAMTSGVTGVWLGTQQALLPEQRAFLERALAYYQEFAAEAPHEAEGQKLLADAHYRVGAMLQSLGRLTEAEAAYRRAVELGKRLSAEHAATPEYRVGLAYSLNALGNLLQRLGRRAEAEAAHRQAVELRERLAAEHPAMHGYRADLAQSLTSLGTLLRDLGRWSEVEAAWSRAVELYGRLAAEHPAVLQYRADQAASLMNLGILRRNLGKRAEAEAPLRQAAELRERLSAEHPTVPLHRVNLASSLYNLGLLLHLDLDQRPEAEAVCRRAVELRERLSAEYPAVPQYRADLGESLHHLGALFRESSRWPEAEATYRRTIELYGRLAAEYPAVPQYRYALGNGHNNLGNLLRAWGRGAEAEAAYQRAIELRERLVAEQSAVPWYVVELGGSYCNLGNLLRDRGELQAALSWYAKAVARLGPVVTAEPRLALAREFLRNSHWNRAEALAKLGRHAEALPDWDRVIELDDGRWRDPFRLSRAVCLARAGEATRAAAEVAAASAAALEVLAKAKDATAETLYDCACALALVVAQETSGADHLATRAVQLLRQAVAKGYTSAAHMTKDPLLNPLRLRADFQKLLAELTFVGPPVPEVARLR